MELRLFSPLIRFPKDGPPQEYNRGLIRRRRAGTIKRIAISETSAPIIRADGVLIFAFFIEERAPAPAWSPRAVLRGR